jgi:UDP-N-acetylglucosamine--N-acetylmuramyl-(pentapeptide) pyrophosphoryl-undecaprenol N-acetylglucosamine transferase
MTTLFVATTGGHLAQLRGFHDRIPADRDGAVWVTHANEHSRSLLSGFEVEFVPYVRVHNLPDVLRCIPHAHRMWRTYGITRAISTGSGIALGYLPYLAARGVECHYIESAARVDGPSLTGRVIRWTPGVRVYTQYQRWAGGRWRYGGNQFDGLEAVPRASTPGDTLRVVVTVGTAAEFPFRRLMVWLVDLLSPGGALQEETGRPVEVLWQTGCTPVDDLPVRATPFVAAADLHAALREADLVICHAGVGSVTAALAAGHAPVVVPRRIAHGEAGDDHQGELAAEVQRRGLATWREADEVGVKDLLAALETSVRRTASLPEFGLVR